MVDVEPPPTKIAKLSDVAEETALHGRPRTSAKAPRKCADLVVNRLEDFYKPNPPFRLPAEIGCFSYDSEGKLVLDRSGLRTYSPPAKIGVDLKVGFSDAQPNKKESAPDLISILTWISHNWRCFQPGLKSSKSFDGSQTVDKGGSASVASSISASDSASTTVSNGTSTSFQNRPDNILTNFVCWRGLMTKFLCTPYNKSEPWKAAASLHHGTIYLRELDTEEKLHREANMSLREKQMCYWGLKFEDYMTSKVSSGSMSSSANMAGKVDFLAAFCTVIRTRINSHSLVMAGEVDCFESQSKEKPPLNYVELKTSRSIYTDRNKASFKRYKLMKWWAQSFLVGVPKIVCGFRDDDGIIQNLQSFRTIDIPKESQNDLSMWQACVCLNFLDELLKWIRATVTDDNPKSVCIMEWKAPFTHISASINPVSSETSVIPDWFIIKEPPPAAVSASSRST